MPKKKIKGGVRLSGSGVKEGSKPKYTPAGKHRKSIKRIVKVIENCKEKMLDWQQKERF